MRAKTLYNLLTACLVFLPGMVMAETSSTLKTEQVTMLPQLRPQLSADGKTLLHGMPARAVMVDPNPAAPRRKIPAPAGLTTEPQAATASFSITYVPSGATDEFGEPCYSFPEEAKAAFNAAAAIWANTITSAVPIAIKACWASLASPTTLGYSGGGNIYRDFTGATRANTWYVESLANSLYGSDLGIGYYDMHITYNQNFAWYYGTDGNTPAGQYDLMTVVLHEIAHGLNFSGSMRYAGGLGSWGYTDFLTSPYYPNIYDVYMRDGAGTSLLGYTNNSAALGSALISDNIWFHGAAAMAANGGQRVKMYAPGTWTPGSSYSHLDYTTFNNTPNQLMVWAISDGESIHDPGVITKGLFQDLGWAVSSTPPPSSSKFPWFMFLPAINGGGSAPPQPPPQTCPSIANGGFESGQSVWSEYSSHGWPIITSSFPGDVTAHAGSYAAWLGGDDDDISYVAQPVTVSASCPFVTFYHWIASEDVCGYDYGTVRVNGNIVSSFDLCQNNGTGGWVLRSVNLSAYSGQTVTLQFRAETDGSVNSNWFVDDVSFSGSGIAVQPTGGDTVQRSAVANGDAAAAKKAVLND